MDIKSENEIKLEELDLEYDSYQQDSQTFSDNESHFVLVEDIKNEELGEKTSIKSELRECKKEPMLGEELVSTDVIKSENLTMMEEKTCAQHLKKLTTLKNVSSLLKKINDKGFDSEFESLLNCC
ncbi:UNVERIFIED_CONTAM: hypothetical protein RMT77_015325 [Armadillidium vulgare]